VNAIKNEIIRASKYLEINVTELSPLESKTITDKIVKKYAHGKKTRFLWENFTNELGINNKNAWEWIKEIIGNNETIMFFNPEDNSIAFKFFNGKDVDDVLGETFGFEFYLTNKTIDYVLCFNHHDVLIACGKAKEWLNKVIKRDQTQ